MNDRGLDGMDLALFNGLSSVVTIISGYILALSPHVYKLKTELY